MAYCGNCAYFSPGAWENDEGRCNYFDINVYPGTGACSNFESAYGGGGGCFLTSACVEYMKKADDCEELTTLRNFRDGYMAKTDEGKKLIKEYYEIAPSIVDKIKTSLKADEYFKDVYATVLNCVNLIKNQNNEEAVLHYRKMVEKYKAI